MKFLSIFTMVLVFTAGGFAQVFDFTIHNETGYDIDSVYVAPADDDEWGDDVMGEEVLEDGHSVEIEFSKAYEAVLLAFNVDKYDLRLEYSDGTEEEYYDLKLEDISDLTLKLDKKGNGVASWK